MTDSSVVAAVCVEAAATVVLAVVAWRALAENHRLSRAAIDQAEAATMQATAATDQAKATNVTVEQIESDRVLNWRPFVVAEHVATDNPQRQDSSPQRFLLTNVGTSPALKCRFVYRDEMGVYRQTPPVSLGAGASTEICPSPGEVDAGPLAPILMDDGSMRPPYATVVFSSILERHYRIGFYRSQDRLIPTAIEDWAISRPRLPASGPGDGGRT